MNSLSERKFYFFEHEKASLHYSVYGSGSDVLFCFHGFGLSGKIFYEIEEFFSENYTIYNFELPFHGQSKWREGEEPITIDFWKEWLSAFCNEKNIATFSLFGYSIGCRLVWASILAFPERVKGAIVIAPDGIKNSLWYTFATNTAFTRAIFKRSLLQNYIDRILKLGRFFKLAPKILIRFAESQLQTEEQRKRVYYTWVTFRKLKADNSKLAKIINEQEIDLTIYLGAQDKIITYEVIRPLTEKLSRKNVITLPSGHSNLVGAVATYLKGKR